MRKGIPLQPAQRLAWEFAHLWTAEPAMSAWHVFDPTDAASEGDPAYKEAYEAMHLVAVPIHQGVYEVLTKYIASGIFDMDDIAKCGILVGCDPRELVKDIPWAD